MPSGASGGSGSWGSVSGGGGGSGVVGGGESISTTGVCDRVAGGVGGGSGDIRWAKERQQEQQQSQQSQQSQQQQQQLRQHQPPSFPDMVVEALYDLSDSRGSSQLATVNWLKASRYGWMATPDEAAFKANVASGIKQVRSRGFLLGGGGGGSVRGREEEAG